MNGEPFDHSTGSWQASSWQAVNSPAIGGIHPSQFTIHSVSFWQLKLTFFRNYFIVTHPALMKTFTYGLSAVV